jgi:hypothetical protein
MQRTTLDEPEGNSLLAVLGGLAIAIGAFVAISWASGHAGECMHLLARVADTTAIVLEGG